MTDLFIPVILGTARSGRRSQAVAELIVELLKQRDTMTDLIDVAEYGITATASPAMGRGVDHYRELVAAADGFVIVAPEYNHGYPGELKLLLDSEYAAYNRKPVGFVSVSSGLIGGARVTEQLRLVTAAFRMVAVAPAVHVTEVESALDDSGGFAAESLAEVAQNMLDEVEWFAGVLKDAREG